MLPTTELAPGLVIPRIVTGLWQVADMERGGQLLDPVAGAGAMAAYAAEGFTAFDMADHYGSAEVITGQARAQGVALQAFTKWCPRPGPMPRDVVRAGVQRALERMRTGCIDLMQFHWWTFEHPQYLDAMAELAALRAEGLVRHLGLTNFDTAHLRVLLAQGIPVASNQVCISLLDRRALGDMSALCLTRGVRLLAYGTLGGGFLSERWLGVPEPARVDDWSKMKYRRFIDAAGGWAALQAVLRAADGIARKHGVSIANVATRWVLEQPAVAAVIVGARLGESEHRADNLALFRFSLDDEDRSWLEEAFAQTRPIPGDCGDEYRKPPFLTASGDLSHHLESLSPVYRAEPVPGRPGRLRVDSGSVWEPLAGYARAVRDGDRIDVSGTTATHGSAGVVAPEDAGAQTTFILDKISASLRSLGGSLDDVVRTRVYLREVDDWEAVARAHGRVFGDIRPSNTMLQVGALIGTGYRVEIEAEAQVSHP
ncbi:aldo/keto reductase [Ramlibacter henchirensis]|uniref:Aldo/keto reductase n=1 Tax=Ramlibacter henchirensis TaxID=204072 RepID=A0A4Z0C2G3_9BURK|nr:aldo/keto reductase [Ramlibacter henchirensis]TFZ05736.1 aldo/keto reductase [Ramlibacter henchirensis]